ncbi:MAG: DUF4388 domain-containing protein [Acidimicrobiales bacterium]|jgi:hypothetical protein
MRTRGPALEGTLADLPLRDVLTLLATSRQTGVLELRGANPGMVALSEGEVTIALSEMGPTLQQVFLGSGITDTDGWDEAITAVDRGVPLTESLIRQGCEIAALRRVLYDHTVGAVFELMLPSSDAFAFLAGERHPIGTTFTFAVANLLEEADARLDAWKQIAEVIPSTAMVMRLRRSLPTSEVTIGADEWHVLSRLDGRTTIAEVIRELGMSAFAVCAVLHRLVELGAVEAIDDPS